MRKNWTETTLGEIAEVNMGQSPPGDTYNTEGIGMPFMQGSAEFGEHYPEPVKFCSAPAKIAEIGVLKIRIDKVEDNLKIKIFDNGVPFPDNIFSGYGLKSIQDKLRLLSGETASMELSNSPEKVVIITLPVSSV